MARTSPIHYIAPSAISITPNANGSQRDLAVYVAKGTKIKVCYQPIADLAYDDANFKQWTLRGRNRSLADADVPYTIYARLKKTDPTNGYLVFAPQTKDAASGEWQDPYILSPNTSATNAMRAEGADGEKYLWGAIPERQAADGRTDYWWVRLGSVSLADSSGQRTVDIDTGTLGTDQYNKDWYLDPDKLPERPVRNVYVERGDWTATPMVAYTGESGSAAPDGTLPAAVAQALGWEGTDGLSLVNGQEISEPYHYRSLTRCRWLTNRLAEYNAGYTDAELYEELTTPSSGWEEENWVETSRVWRDGRLWECLVEGATDVPSEASLQWKLLLRGGEDAYDVALTKSSDAAVIDPSGNVVGGYRTVTKDGSGNEFYTYRFHTSVTVTKGGEYLHLCGALDDDERLGDGNFTVEAVGAGCELEVTGTTCYITYIWHCNDGDADTDPYTSYNRTPEEYQMMRAMTEAVAHITLNIEGKTSVTKDYRLQLVHLPTDTVIIEIHNEVAAVNWSTKKNAWTNRQDIVIPLTASSGGQPVMFQTVNGGTAPDIRLLNKPGWLSGTPGYGVAWADYDEDGDGRAEYTASQHMSVEITIPIANILRTWQENGTTKEIGNTNLLKFNVITVVDGVEYENVVPFTLNVTTDKAIYVLAPSVRQVTGTMIGGTWDTDTNTMTDAIYNYVAAGEACNKVTCRLMCYDQNDQLTEITSAGAIHDDLTFFINGQASTLEGFRTDGVENTAVGDTGHNLFDELSEIVFAIKMDGKDYESEGVPILRNGANLSIGSNGNWYIGGVDTGVFAKGTEVTGTTIFYTDPIDASTPPEYAPATAADRGKPVSPYLKTECPASVEGKFIHYVNITVFSDSEETYVYSYGTLGTGSTITVIHDRDFYASPSELTQTQLAEIGNASWSESTPDNYSAVNKYLYSRDTARYYQNGAEQTVTVGGITYPHIVYTMLGYWGQDGSGVEFAYYRAGDDSQANKPTVDVLNRNHKGAAKNPVIADWNGSDGGWYDDHPGFTAQGQVMYQSVNKYSNGQWSGWGDPVIIDRYAQDSVRLDIDNEMDTVQTDSTGKITSARTVETVVHLYDGPKEVDISAATLSVSGGPASSVAAYSAAASGKGKKLSWAFISGKNMADTYEITVSYVHNSVTYSAVFTVTASKGQAVYQLKPSQSAVVYSRQADNTLASENSTLKVNVLKIDGESTATKAATAANLTAWGLTIRYSTSSMPGSASAGNEWPTGNSLTVDSTVDNVYVAMFNSSGTLLDRETVPVVCDGTNGKNGEDSVRPDLTNEFQMVLTSHEGTVVADTTLVTTIIVYAGEKALYTRNPIAAGIATKAGSTILPDVYPDGSAQYHLVTYNIPKGTVLNNKYDLDISVDYDGKTYTTQFTVAASLGDPEYHLNPSWPCLPFKRGENNTLTPNSRSLEMTVLKIDYEDTADMTVEESGMIVRYTTNGTPPSTKKSGKPWGTSDGATGITWSDGVMTVANSTDVVSICVAMFNSLGTLLDRETIPIIKDGTNGNDGKDGKDGKYEDKQYCRSAASSSTNGSTPPTDIDTSYGSSGWGTTPPITKVQYPFIWQRTRMFDPNTNTATSWVYARLTGETGSQGATGHVGRWYYYAGVWDANTTYTMDETRAPYVKYGDNFYMLDNHGGAATSIKTMPPNAPGDGNPWTLIDTTFKYYIAEAYFGNYAHLGSFIINGDWMISQYGLLYTPGGETTINSTNYQNLFNYKVPYEHFDPAYPDSRKASNSFNFCPNFAVDGKTGKTYQMNATVKGKIEATEGSIGGFSIGTDALNNTNYAASVVIQNAASSPTKVAKLGKDAKDAITNESCSLEAQSKGTGTYNTALYLEASGATYNYAFHGNGNGVLNGLMFGFKTKVYTVSGTGDSTAQMILTDGATFVFQGSKASGKAYFKVPTLSNVKLSLGLPTGSSVPFAIELNFINHSSYDYVYLQFYNSSRTTLPKWYDYNFETTAEEMQLARGDFARFLLTFDGSNYRANRIIHHDDGR